MFVNTGVEEKLQIDFNRISNGERDEMVKLGLEKVENMTIPIDILVYPLIYSARHRIELFLKHQLIKIDYVKNKLLSNKNTKQIIRTHEISKLWELLKNETSFDPRFKDTIKDLDDYIKDFAQIDDTGEVFRYPISINGNKHLDSLGVVNLLSFKNRYLELTDKLENLDYFSSFIVTEYQQKTFAGSLSREMIKKIATELPQIGTWEKNPDVIKKIKENIKTKYDISSNTLSKAINIIKTNFEFSIIIGQELKIKEITDNELIEFFQIYNNFLKDLFNILSSHTQFIPLLKLLFK